MAIQVSCPSCESAVHVDDTLAGKDILCPNCQQRITVPSIASGRPEAKPRGGDAWDENIEEGRGEDRGGRESIPRYRAADDDIDLPPLRDRHRWNATTSGLSLLSWTWALLAVVLALGHALTMAGGRNQQFFMGGGGNPQAGSVALAVGMMVTGCSSLVLYIVGFVGMCMCCTVPSESGAKGRAITALLLVVLLIVGMIVFMVVLFFALIQQAQRMGAPPAPGQLPPNALLLAMILGGVGSVLIVTMWLMFHKAIADYFQNVRLARATIWFVVAFAVFQISSRTLDVLAQSELFQGNLLATPDTLMLVLAGVWGSVGIIGLSIWYVYIALETRRTILEDEAAPEGNRYDDEHVE